MELFLSLKVTFARCLRPAFFQKIIFTLFIFIAIISCTKENLIDTVKKSVLKIDRTISIGKSLDSYTFFKQKSYEEITDDKGRRIVRFIGTLSLNFNDYIQQSVWDAKNAMPDPGSVRHAMKMVDLVWKNRDAQEICKDQWESNRVEADRIIKEAGNKKDFQVKLIIDFSKAIDNNEIVILKQDLGISKDVNGQTITLEPECNTESVAEKILIGTFKNIDPFNLTKECLLKYNIKPCSLEK